MIKSFRLPFQFDAENVRSDLEHFSEVEWIGHFNTSYYEGKWSGITLRAPEGNEKSLYIAPNEKRPFQNTTLMAHFPSVQKILNHLSCPIHGVRFLLLEKGAVIKEHSDHTLSFEE